MRVLAFERNAGQSAAMYAGLHAARGRRCALLDGDLQNDPADIPRLLAELERSGADLVCGYRARRKDTLVKRLTSRVANFVRSRFTRDGVRDTGCTLKAMRRECVGALVPFVGMHRFIPALVKGAGFRLVEFPVNHRAAAVRREQIWPRQPRVARDGGHVRRALAALAAVAVSRHGRLSIGGLSTRNDEEFMKPSSLPALFIVLAGASRAFAQAAPTPFATPADIPAPVVSTAQTTPASAVCPVCGSAECKDEKPAPPAESDETVLTQLEHAWSDAVVKHDVDFIERMEADDYVSTGPDGAVLRKADDLAVARAQFVKIESFILSDVKVRVFGETAVVTGETTFKGTAGDANVGGDFRWTDVFVNHDGHWQAEASQATRISKPAAGG